MLPPGFHHYSPARPNQSICHFSNAHGAHHHRVPPLQNSPPQKPSPPPDHLYFPETDKKQQQQQQPTASTTFDLRSYWSSLISSIHEELSSILLVRYPQSIHRSMRHAVLSPGAKRAPPVLCVAAASDLLLSPLDAALPTAAALEMVHSASLVHDDLPCMDASPICRGRPSTHSLFGVSTTLLAGDALFPLAFHHIIHRTPRHLVPDSSLVAVVAEIARAVGSTGMAAGHFLDLADNADVVDVLERKVGEMAECSAVCGGFVGGADGEVLEALRRYGRAVGVLYELVDDMLIKEVDEGGKMRSNASVVRALGMERAMGMVDELRGRATREVGRFEERYGVERAASLWSFVNYAVERGFEVKGLSESVVGEDDGDVW